MSRVFVLQEQKRYDISAVKYYSKEIVFVLQDEHVSPFDTYSFIDLVRRRLKVKEFDPENDFICLTGSSILLSLFMATLMQVNWHSKQFKVLIFDAKTSKYKLRILNFGA
jgi:hypothetical protein